MELMTGFAHVGEKYKIPTLRRAPGFLRRIQIEMRSLPEKVREQAASEIRGVLLDYASRCE
jgi:hypothetical protein